MARLATYAAEPDAVDAEAVLIYVQLALGDGVRYLDRGFQSLVGPTMAVALATVRGRVDRVWVVMNAQKLATLSTASVL